MSFQPVKFYQTGTFTVGNRLLPPEERSVQSQSKRYNSINSGHRACQGCGEALGARYAIDAVMEATNGRLICANATGCLEVFSTPYPETSWQVPWIHSLFGNTAAVATGIAAALKVKQQKGERRNIRVVAQGGDGGTTDIGFGCLSGMFERNDDVLYICYDNQGYMNTGIQRSSATPPAARTATTMAVGAAPGNVFGQGKFVPAIAMAHEIPYVATATVADLRDLEAKVRRAMELRGARYIHILVPCPLGWGSASHETIRLARLAKETGLFPVFEAEHGELKSVLAIRRPLPVEDYLKPQKRYAHLFGKTPQVEVIARLQAMADRNIRKYGLLEETEFMDKPFAITLDPGSSLANHTGSWRTMRPVYLDRLPPCNAACPAGENIQGWLYHAESGDYEKAWRALTENNPLPAIMGRVCYHPCQGACNRQFVDSAVGINAVERFLGDEAIKRGWAFDKPAGQTGKRVLVVGAGPSGLSAAYHLARLGHSVEIHEAGPMAGGMMRFGIPKYRLPRDIIDAEVQRIVDLGVTIRYDIKVANIAEAMQAGKFDAAFLAVGAHIGKRAFIPAADATKIVDAVSVLRSMEGEDKPMLGRRVVVYGGGNTAMDVARTAKRMGAVEAIIVYRRTREKAPAHDSEIEEALQEGVMVKWLSTIKQAGEGEITIEKMALDDKGFPQPTGEFETLAADSVVLALGQDVDLGLLDGVSGLTVTDGVVQVGANMMTGHPGIFAGGDMVPSERTVTVAVGHGKKAARHIDAWLRHETWQPAPKHELAGFEKINPWYYSEAHHQVRPVLDIIRRQSSFDEVVQGLDEVNAQFEARRCLSCGNCFECDNCYGVCPDNAVIKLGPGKRFQFNYDYCKGCGVCVAECPCGAIKMVAEEI